MTNVVVMTKLLISLGSVLRVPVVTHPSDFFHMKFTLGR